MRVNETQCLQCGRRYWRDPGKEAEACPICGEPCKVTDRFKRLDDLPIGAKRHQASYIQGRGINPQEAYTLKIPSTTMI